MSRKIISLSIREDLLTRVDQMIDGTVIRNRSHALETILVNYFHEEKVQVLILAGGKETTSFSDEKISKCMLELGGKPILEHIIDNLITLGVHAINISISSDANEIIDHFGDGSEFGIKINYIRETEPTGTAGALLKCKKHLNRRFLLIYGDNFFRFDLLDMVEFHEKNKSFATVGLTTVADPTAFGVVSLKGSKIVDYKEKPSEIDSFIINAGIYVFEQDVFNYISPNSKSLERDVLPQLAAEGKLCGYTLAGQWLSIDSVEDLMTARKLLDRKKH